VRGDRAAKVDVRIKDSKQPDDVTEQKVAVILQSSLKIPA
jgi:hypothetical protein